MSDTLEIFGDEFTNVTGIKATDDNGNIKTYIRPQGTKSITQNGTGIDVTNYANVDVSVSGGGGGASPWTLIHSEELTVSTTSTADSSTKAITLSGIYTSSKILYVRIRDKAGKRAGYFYGTDNFIINPNPANGETNTVSTFIARYVIRYTTSNIFQSSLYSSVNGYGVYVYNLTSSGQLNLHQRYNTSSSLTIDGTYTVEVYTLDWPDGISPFDA